ncbi:MAG: cystathionine beta-synthase [Deltaproteobacteria bacterium]|nr:MAG: cystathionine beta-synthase [Deltaproteobacteria bacterium]
MAQLLSLIGNTPILELTKFDTGSCRLFIKLESQNPGGSIKDRIALSMIASAEKQGLLKPGGLIVEATAGNTGIGLALVAKLKGYRMALVIPDKMSREKIEYLKALGAEIIITRSDVPKGHPEYYQDLAEKIANERNGYYVNQFGNPANPLAHETSTGPEIWEQMNHDIDAIVVGVGSSGTMTGLTKYFQKVAPHVEIILADPKGSILAEYVKTGVVSSDVGSWLVEGIGEDFIPSIADFSMTKKAYTVSDRESFEKARELLTLEGVFAGSSSGTLLAAALKYCQEQTSPKKVLTFACDTGSRYLSKMFNNIWMQDLGFLGKAGHHDLRDLISRKHEEGSTVFVSPEDTLHTAYARMKLNDVSQLPVLSQDAVVGLIDESDILYKVYEKTARFESQVKEVMNTQLVKLSPRSSVEELMKIFKQGFVAIIESETDHKFLGIITQIDLLNALRKSGSGV